MIAPGVRLNDRYEIVSPLGAGGMGEVYRARDARLHREVAVKVLPQRLAQDEGALGRFEREARSLAALSHPHIVSLHDFGSHDGLAYAVMELLEGETLRQRLQRGPMGWAEAVGLGAQMAEGLAAAHGKGVVHRDLKPENVILSRTGTLKILDFGLARTDGPPPPSDETPTSAPTQPGVVLGTLSYMPPEQVRGQTVDPRGDIFALGCVLYEMVSGRPPFARATTADTVAALLTSEPPDLSSAPAPVPPALEQAILRALSKDPDSRFQSAQDLAFALRMISGVSRAGSAPFPVPAPASPHTRRGFWIVAAAALLGLAGWLAWSARGGPPAVGSLAVLPFANAGGDAELDYLGDGITDSLIHDLSQLRDVRVMARSTVFRYRGPDVEPRRAGRELKVDAVLTGRVVPRGDALTVEAELVDVASGSRLWGERYQGRLDDVVRVPEEVAREISSTLRLRLTQEQQARLGRRETEDPEAYRLYLKGRYHWNKRTADGFRKGIEYFEQASARDPGYALPQVGLADSFALMAAYSVRPPGESMTRARAAAERALALDDSLAEAHASLGLVKLLHDWEWDEAERRFRRALALKPNLAIAHDWFAEFFMARGRTEEALGELQRAEELDPLSVILPTDRCRALYFARRYPEALASCRRALDADAAFVPALITQGMVLEETGRSADALAAFQEVARLTGNDPQQRTLIARATAIGGDLPAARRMLAEIAEQGRSRYISPYSLAVVHAALGEKDEAFRQLDRAIAERSSWMTYAAVNPRLDALRSDPRFQEVLKRVGLRP